MHDDKSRSPTSAVLEINLFLTRCVVVIVGDGQTRAFAKVRGGGGGGGGGRLVARPKGGNFPLDIRAKFPDRKRRIVGRPEKSRFARVRVDETYYVLRARAHTRVYPCRVVLSSLSEFLPTPTTQHADGRDEQPPLGLRSAGARATRQEVLKLCTLGFHDIGLGVWLQCDSSIITSLCTNAYTHIIFL